MAIIKISPTSDYTIVPNSFITDKNLSWVARGILLYLCSKPEDWIVTLHDLINQTAESNKPSGRDAVRSALSELQKHGYLKKTQKRKKGKFLHHDYICCFSPFTDLPSTANPPLQNKDHNKVKKYTVHQLKADAQNYEKKLYVKQLDPNDFAYLHVAHAQLEELSQQYKNIYLGGNTADAWISIESQLECVVDHVQYLNLPFHTVVSTFIKNLYLTRGKSNPNLVGLKYLCALVDRIDLKYLLDEEYDDLLGIGS